MASQQQIIRYNRVVRAEAMNKRPYQKGIMLIDDSSGNITINSINSKDGLPTSHLHIQIPIEHVPELLEALSKIYNEHINYTAIQKV